jgi:hypothetical protein
LLPAARSACDDLEPVDTAGQHAVEHDRVVGFPDRERHAVAAVVGPIDDVAGFEQAFLQKARHLLIVFDQEDFHFWIGGPSVTRRVRPDRKAADVCRSGEIVHRRADLSLSPRRDR